MKLKHIVAASVAALAAIAAFAERDTAIYRGKLTSDLNANQHSITNLPDGFFPEETDPTVADWAKKPNPAPVTDLTPAINYTDSATNAVITNLTARLGAKVSTNDFVLATNNLASSVSGLQSSKADRSEIPGNYPAVSNKAMTAVQVETDPTVPSWAKQPKMPLAEEIRKGTNAITATGMKICEGEIYGPGIGYWLGVEHGLTNYLEWAEGENAWRRSGSQYPQIKFNGAEIRFYESAQYWHPFRASPWEGWHSFTGWEVCYVKGRSVVTNELLTAEKDPTVPNWAKQPEPPEAMPGNGVVLTNGTVKTKDGTAIQPEHIGAGSAAEMAETRAIVTTWEQFLDGSNVVFSITNYISGIYNLDAAKLRITELRDGAYREVYNSRDEILLHIDHFSNSYVRVALDAVVEEVAQRLADKADRAWGNHTSAGGNAPSNTVYMTAPNTVFAGGMEYERVAVGQGAVCVLTTKGAPVYTQGDEGTFKFQDDGGTNYFGFAKTDSYVIGCNTDGISVQNQIVTLEYDVTMSGVPCIWYRESLQDEGPWVQCNTPDGEPISGAPKVVQWEQNPGAGKEICYINCSEASGFFKATIEVAGEAKFMTNMKADLNGGVLCTDGQTVIYPHANGSWSTTK